MPDEKKELTLIQEVMQVEALLEKAHYNITDLSRKYTIVKDALIEIAARDEYPEIEDIALKALKEIMTENE